jgi:hypothetical protein
MQFLSFACLGYEEAILSKYMYQEATLKKMVDWKDK